MSKVNGPYAPQDIGQIQTGRRMTAEQYERIILNQHAIYAQHRARCPGWRWPFTTASPTLTTANSTAGQPDLNWYQPRLLLERPDGSGQLNVAFRVYGRNYEIEASLHLFGGPGTPVTLAGTSSFAWTQIEFSIGSFPGVVPVDFYFRARATSGTATILRIIPDEPTLTGIANIP